MQAVISSRQLFPLNRCQHCTHLAMQDHLPRVQIAASVFSAIARAAEQQKPHVILQLSISVTPTNQVAALVQELDPLGEQQLHAVTSSSCKDASILLVRSDVCNVLYSRMYVAASERVSDSK